MENNNIVKCIKHRRSIRRFEEQQIAETELQMILDAGLYAPSAGGRQGVLFVVTQDKEMNQRLGRIKLANSHYKKASGGNYISKDQPSIADDPTIKNAFYDAPTVITLFAPKDFLFAKEDCGAAGENMMLMADSLGIGSCYLGEAYHAFADPYGQNMLETWKVRSDYYAVAQIVFGYPRSTDNHPVAKKRKKKRIFCF